VLHCAKQRFPFVRPSIGLAAAGGGGDCLGDTFMVGRRRPGRNSPMFTKFVINNSANFLLARLSGILSLTQQDIPDISQKIHQF
jgi:hypothetical protein